MKIRIYSAILATILSLSLLIACDSMEDNAQQTDTTVSITGEIGDAATETVTVIVGTEETDRVPDTEVSNNTETPDSTADTVTTTEERETEAVTEAPKETVSLPEGEVEVVSIAAEDHIFGYVYRCINSETGDPWFQIVSSPLDPLPEYATLDHVLRGKKTAYVDTSNIFGHFSAFIFADPFLYVYTPETRECTRMFRGINYTLKENCRYHVVLDIGTREHAALCIFDNDLQKYAVYSFETESVITDYAFDGFEEFATDGKLLMTTHLYHNPYQAPAYGHPLLSLTNGAFVGGYSGMQSGMKMRLIASPDGKTQYYQLYNVLAGNRVSDEGGMFTSEFRGFANASVDPVVTEGGELYCTCAFDFVDETYFTKVYRYAPDGTALPAPQNEYLWGILQIFRDYIVSIGEDGYVHITDFEGNLIRTVCEWKDTMRYNRDISAWKEGNALYKMGLYLIFENEEDYQIYEYGYIPGEEELYFDTFEHTPAYAKPVLYLYPEEPSEINVVLQNADRLTVSYPKYPMENGWTVTAQPDGTLTDGRRSYYCLYWEEDCIYDAAFNEGFCVKGQDSAAFLEDALDKLGLSEREANEFIIYWLPILEASPYNCIYFECTEERQAKSPLLITPAPDTLIRIAMHILPCEEYISLPTQALTAPERVGFCAVEWGGVVYESMQ